MYRFTEPSDEELRDFARARADAPVFSESGEIPDQPPAGFARNAIRSTLGRGELAFAAARHALRNWEQFPEEWIAVRPAHTPVELGEPAVVVARLLGIYTVNVCRIVWLEDTATERESRFAFTYATVPDHAMRGAEIFAVVWDRTSDEVYYELVSISRPNQLFAWLVLPYVRWMQRYFGRSSCAALRSAVEERLNALLSTA